MPDAKPCRASSVKLSGIEPEETIYTAVKLIEGGLLEGKPHRSSQTGKYDEALMLKITLKGHQFLD